MNMPACTYSVTHGGVIMPSKAQRLQRAGRERTRARERDGRGGVGLGESEDREAPSLPLQ